MPFKDKSKETIINREYDRGKEIGKTNHSD